MTYLDKILLILGAIIVLPIIAFLCMKLGTVGFYKGKEAINKEDKKRGGCGNNCYGNEEIKN